MPFGLRTMVHPSSPISHIAPLKGPSTTSKISKTGNPSALMALCCLRGGGYNVKQVDFCRRTHDCCWSLAHSSFWQSRTACAHSQASVVSAMFTCSSLEPTRYMSEPFPVVTQAFNARMGITQRGLSCLLDLKYEIEPCLKTNQRLFHLHFSPLDLLDLIPIPHFKMGSVATLITCLATGFISSVSSGSERLASE